MYQYLFLEHYIYIHICKVYSSTTANTTTLYLANNCVTASLPKLFMWSAKQKRQKLCYKAKVTSVIPIQCYLIVTDLRTSVLCFIHTSMFTSFMFKNLYILTQLYMLTGWQHVFKQNTSHLNKCRYVAICAYDHVCPSIVNITYSMVY